MGYWFKFRYLEYLYNRLFLIGIVESTITCVDTKDTQIETTLSGLWKNASFVPQAPVTAACMTPYNSDGFLYLYTADGFRHVYDVTITFNSTADHHTASYSYNAQQSQNVSDLFGGRTVDAATFWMNQNSSGSDQVLLFEFSGYSIYQNGTYLGEISAPCERELVTGTGSGQPEMLININ